jgi:hypothetical protein
VFSGEISVASVPPAKLHQPNIIPQCVTSVAFHSELLARTVLTQDCSLPKPLLVQTGTECCHALALLQSLLEMSHEAQHSSQLKKASELIQKNFDQMLNICVIEDKSSLVEILLEKSVHSLIL